MAIPNLYPKSLALFLTAVWSLYSLLWVLAAKLQVSQKLKI